MTIKREDMGDLPLVTVKEQWKRLLVTGPKKVERSNEGDPVSTGEQELTRALVTAR